MHQKYLSKILPTLADGDYMGIFLGDDVFQLNLLIEEGLARQEEIILSAGLLDFVSPDYLGKVGQFKNTSFDFLLSFLKNKSNALSPDKTGFRLLLDSDELYGNLNHNERRSGLDKILKILMGGEVSIGVIHGDLNSLSVSELSCYPRVMVNGSVATNKFFVLPQRALEEESELLVLFEQVESKSMQFPMEGEPFPTGVPDMLEAIIESMGVGIVVGDNYGNMILFNRSAQSIMGLPPSPLPYAERIRRFGNYLPDKVTPYPFDCLPLSRAIRGETFENELIFIKHKNKNEGVWVQTTGRGVRASDGKLLGGVLVFRDVTEEQKVQEEKDLLEKSLVQNQKLESLGVLAGGIAHDFNNLLVGVLGNASIVLQQDGVSEALKPRVEQIQEAGLQLSDLTKQLLIYAGLNPNKGYQPIDLNSIVSLMSGLVEAAVSKKMQLTLALSNGVHGLIGDEVQIRQILLNLAINAADAYGSAGGELIIRTKEAYVRSDVLKKSFYAATEKEGDFVCFEVEDFAGGIQEELITKVFDPFFSTKGIGRGLGLSAVLGIVKAHQGFLELETKQGVGTKFSVWFPRADAGVKVNESVKIDNKLKSEGKTVLLVDDEELVLEVADSILSLNGFRPVRALSGRQGIDLLKKENSSLSLVILDMNMPDLSGEDVYKEVRKLAPELPVVISSGFSKELCSLEKFDDDNCYFLEKPYSVDKLLNLVVQLVG